MRVGSKSLSTAGRWQFGAGLMVWSLVGCTGGDAVKDDAATDAEATTEAQGTEGTGDSGLPEDYVVVSGTAKDADGAGVASEARLCRGLLCLTTDVETNGAFTFPDAAPEWSSFEIFPASTSLATVFAPVELVASVDRQLTVVVPALSTKVTLPAKAEEIEVAGLYLTMGAGDLEAPLFGEVPTEVAASRVEEAQWPPLEFATPHGGTPYAVYYLWPFDLDASEPIPVRFGLKGLSAGRQMKVYVGDYGTSAWIDLGTFTSGVDGFSGAALPKFSTVVVVDVTAK